jgi:hypothetical protein
LVQIMELALNLAWFVLAVAMVLLWLRQSKRSPCGRRGQVVALGVLLFILLPAISMTDDLLAAQKPAEVDCCLRRVHEFVHSHTISPAPPALPQRAFASPPVFRLQLAAPGFTPAPKVDPPALSAIQNRPPPAA